MPVRTGDTVASARLDAGPPLVVAALPLCGVALALRPVRFSVAATASFGLAATPFAAAALPLLALGGLEDVTALGVAEGADLPLLLLLLLVVAVSRCCFFLALPTFPLLLPLSPPRFCLFLALLPRRPR